MPSLFLKWRSAALKEIEKHRRLKKLCFATNNQHKLEEVKNLLKDFQILSLKDIGCTVIIPEDFRTISENSKQKAEFIFKNFGVDCFADDSGLEVDALNGAPGVDSAHYAGSQRNDQENYQRVLKELKGVTNRNARFVTVITLVQNGVYTQFAGYMPGRITDSPYGAGGFGYDPVFQPDGFSCTVAEMTMEEKNKISHRAQAVKKLIAHLLNQSASDLV